MAAVQGNGWKLADVFDGAVPGQAVVHVGNDAQIDAVGAGLFEHVLHQLALAGRGKEDLVDKQRARACWKRVSSVPTTSAEVAVEARSRFRENR